MDELKEILHRVLNEINSLKSSVTSTSKPKSRTGAFIFGLIFSLLLLYAGVFASQHLPQQLVKIATFNQPKMQEIEVADDEQTPTVTIDKKFDEQAELIRVVSSKSDTLVLAIARIENKLNDVSKRDSKLPLSESNPAESQAVVKSTENKSKAPVFSIKKGANAPVF